MRSTADQYRIIATGAGWIDRADRGRLRFDGRDALRFLQGLVTNDVQPLAEGRSVYAAYLTPQGRMVSDLTIHPRGDHFIVEVPAAAAKALALKFDELIFTEDVRVSDVSESVAQLSLVGGGAPALAGTAGGVDLFVDAADRGALIARLESLGAIQVSRDLFDALRIDAGRPEFGVDMTEDTIPLEAGLLDRAISTTKGCYVGQEIIIRVLHRGGGRVARRLVRLQFDPRVTTPPAAGTPIARNGHDVGRITSAAVSPATGRVVALGYVQRDHAEAGVTIDAGGHAAEIVGFAG